MFSSNSTTLFPWHFKCTHLVQGHRWFYWTPILLKRETTYLIIRSINALEPLIYFHLKHLSNGKKNTSKTYLPSCQYDLKYNRTLPPPPYKRFFFHLHWSLWIDVCVIIHHCPPDIYNIYTCNICTIYIQHMKTCSVIHKEIYIYTLAHYAKS